MRSGDMVRDVCPRSHRTPERGMAGTPFRATYIWTSIISNLHSRVEVKPRRHNLKLYNDCFLGSEAVDVVLTHIAVNRFFGTEAVPRYKAVRLCQTLMDSKVFEPVGVRVFGKEKKKPRFEDSSCSLYRFLSSETTSSSAATDTNSQTTGTNQGSYGSTCSNQNKNDYTLSCERDEIPTYSTHSPVKRGKLLEDVLENLDLSSAITPQMIRLGLSQECLYEVLHQQIVSRLLQLIELPLLDDLLEGDATPQPLLRGTDSDPDLLYTSSYLDREVLKAFSEAQADEWMSGAVDCLEFLPDEQVVEVSRGLAGCSDDLLQCKKLLYQVLVKHYGQTQRPPLLSNYFFDVYSGISELLVNGKLEQALEALQLSLKLQDSRSREELRRLLRFMATAARPQEVKLHKEIENRMAVKRAFSRAIIYSRRLPKGKLDLTVLFMMDNCTDLFQIPASLQKLVSERLRNIVNGTDPNGTTGVPVIRASFPDLFAEQRGGNLDLFLYFRCDARLETKYSSVRRERAEDHQGGDPVSAADGPREPQVLQQREKRSAGPVFQSSP
ncbi:DEP domain-containing protein 7 isoform X2 [Kryptolebias marmoratus]|uniref:DEP domain-containing protein 7 isoform X2 n=1 Tax=Kryptolebias marmoratus TaxID=37003 RepID=UPI0018ACCE15|nr:DEP domain-containing protein 7 isoform X2 [Kryptolebias marmoratus]